MKNNNDVCSACHQYILPKEGAYRNTAIHAQSVSKRNLMKEIKFSLKRACGRVKLPKFMTNTFGWLFRFVIGALTVGAVIAGITLIVWLCYHLGKFQWEGAIGINPHLNERDDPNNYAFYAITPLLDFLFVGLLFLIMKGVSSIGKNTINKFAGKKDEHDISCHRY